MTGLDLLLGDSIISDDDSVNGDDILYGGAGNDLISGDAYFLYGNTTAGSDIIIGGKGDDFLVGDAFRNFSGSNAKDTFVFDLSGDGDGHDTIWDFEALDFLQFENVMDTNADGISDRTDLDNLSRVVELFGNAKIEFDLDNDGDFDDASIGLSFVAFNGGDSILDYVDAANVVIVA